MARYQGQTRTKHQCEAHRTSAVVTDAGRGQTLARERLRNLQRIRGQSVVEISAVDGAQQAVPNHTGPDLGGERHLRQRFVDAQASDLDTQARHDITTSGLGNSEEHKSTCAMRYWVGEGGGRESGRRRTRHEATRMEPWQRLENCTCSGVTLTHTHARGTLIVTKNKNEVCAAQPVARGGSSSSCCP